MKTTIEVGDVVVAANGQTTQILFSGAGRYMCAVCVSVNPFILISREGDMRWSTRKIEDFVSTGKAPSDVLKICMDRLKRDINSGEVTSVVIEPSIPVSLEKVEPVLKTTIEVGDIVQPVDGNGKTSRHLFSGGYYYAQAVCVSVEPFILISETGDMRWSSKKSENFVSQGKARPDVLEVCMDRLRRDIEEGEVTGVVIEPKPISLEKAEPVLKSIPLEEEKEVWMRAWVAAKISNKYNDECQRSANACVKQYTETFGGR